MQGNMINLEGMQTQDFTATNLKKLEKQEVWVVAQNQGFQNEVDTAKQTKSQVEKGFDTSDKYFKSEKNEQNRKYENARQEVVALRELSKIVPNYFTRGEYNVEFFDGGQLRQGKDQISHLKNRIAKYAFDYEGGFISEDLELLVVDMQSSVDSFESSINTLIQEEVQDEGVEQSEKKIRYTSTNEKTQKMLELYYNTPYYDLDEVFAEYGNDFRIVFEAIEYKREFGHFDVREQVTKKIGKLKEIAQKQKLDDDKTIEKISNAKTKVQDYLKEDAEINITEALNTVVESASLSLGYVDIPSLKESVEELKSQREIAKQKFADRLYLNQSDVLGLTEEQIIKIVNVLNYEQSAKVLASYFNQVPLEQSVKFVQDRLNDVFPLDITSALHLALAGEVKLDAEKESTLRESLLNIAITGTKEISKSQMSRNICMYRLLLTHLEYTKKQENGAYEECRSRIIESLPTGVQFMIQHEQQMVIFHTFLKGVLEGVFAGDKLSQKDKDKLELLLTSRDGRYPEINKMFETMRIDLQRSQ